MPAANIKVYLRVRPSGKPSANFVFAPEQGIVSFQVDKHKDKNEVDNTKTQYEFRFNGIMPMSAAQSDVFNTIAKPVIDDVLGGVNGTIFAYGQTGSGKTFTVTGGGRSRDDAGLIPRTISHFFNAFRSSGDAQYRMLISYLEIYNNEGFDLLPPEDECSGKLHDLPKVTIRTDDDGLCHLKGLSVNVASSEEEALNLLFMGDTNRVVAETPMNDASTRSHCLFVIWIESTSRSSDVVRRSKLHLVDLAGSERPSKTGVEGNLLKEATHINLSLLYLEQVIVALHDRAKNKNAFIPYRNSMMTSVLRDSLGGNCKTTMIGCIAVEEENLDESRQTCFFAQRVAQVQNNARVNEELDPNLLIARLKREVTELQQEVRVAKSGEPETLSPEVVDQCRALVLQYVRNTADPSEPFVCGSVERLRASFKLLRDMCKARQEGGGGGTAGEAGGELLLSAGDEVRAGELEAHARQLRLEIAQREKEIGLLADMLGPAAASRLRAIARDLQGRGDAPEGRGARRSAGANAAPMTSSFDAAPAAAVGRAAGASPLPPTPTTAADLGRTLGARTASSMDSGHSFGATGTVERLRASVDEARVADLEAQVRQLKAEAEKRDREIGHLSDLLSKKAASAASGERTPSGARLAGGRRAPPHTVPLPPASAAAELLLDPEKAFKAFSDMAPKNEAVEDNKELLRVYMTRGQALGEGANTVKKDINDAKTRLEQLRSERAMRAAGRDDIAPLQDGPEELAELQEIERLRLAYKERIDELRQVKTDIVNVQRFLEQSRLRTKKDFEAWFASLRSQASMQHLDEGTKRDLYEKVTGAPMPPGAEGGSRPSSARQAAGAGVPRPPAQPGAQAPRAAGNSKTDSNISAFYAALGVAGKKPS